MLSATDLTFGYEHTADTAHVRVNDNFDGFPYAENANASSTDNALYLGLQSTLWRRLILTSQVRQDWEAPNTPTTWRVGSVFDASEIDTHFKAAYGTAFRAPSLFDRYGVDSFGYVGNPNLKPESAQGWETGFTTTLPALASAGFRHLRRNLFQRAGEQSDRDGGHHVDGGNAGEHRFGAYPGRGDRAVAASRALAYGAGDMDLHRCEGCRTAGRLCCAGRGTPHR